MDLVGLEDGNVEGQAELDEGNRVVGTVVGVLKNFVEDARG